MTSIPPSTINNSSDKEAQETLASLTRVSHKLALTEAGDRFASVLDKLLPKLLQRIGENASNKDTSTNLKEQIQSKLMEMFSHVMKRVKEDPTCPLPCAAILRLLLLPSSDGDNDNKYQFNSHLHPMTLHLALAFLTLGVPRCENPYPLLPSLMACQSWHIASASRKSQSQQMAHLLLHCLSSTLKQQQFNNKKKKNDENENEEYLQATRQLIQENETLQATLFDLFLDVLLYPANTTTTTSSSSSLPPPGLSQAGHERLREQQASIMAWQAAVLEWIAPQRKALLMMDSTKGRARTIGLLVVTAQSSAIAQAHLKQYLESFRGTSATSSSTDDTNDPESLRLLGDPVPLVWTLLSLCLGQSHAESTVKDTTVEDLLYLGRSRSDDDGDTTPQLLLSIKRRPLTDHSSILSFVSTHVFQNHPRLLLLRSNHNNNNNMSNVVNLALHVVEKTLDASVIPSSGLSTLRAKPYMHAAELLHILAIRLAALDDDDDVTSYRGESLVQFQRRIMLVACRVLTPASSSSSLHTSSTTRQSIGSSDGNVVIRDACYGTVSTLCRSSFALSGYIFVGDGSTSNSVQTASMLFGCAAHEEEKLKPRAVAALDALLGTYIRLYNTRALDDAKMPEETSNPWATTTTIETNDTNTTTNSPSTADRTKLLGALLPLVWTAAQSYQPKASRVAAARWAAELLQTLDRASACHVLCFLAGDIDPTAANLAREGLGLSANLEESEYDMVAKEQESSVNKLPDFGRFVSFVFQDPSKQTSDTLFRSHHFEDFSFKGKAVTLHFGMRCLLNDFYGGSDDSIRSFLEALTRSLALYKSGSIRVDSAHALQAVDLLDVCSSCMAALLCASKFAREYLANGDFGMKDLQELAVHVSSSRARRYLAKSCGILLGDIENWGEEDHQISAGQLDLPFDLCLSNLSDIDDSRVGSLSRMHGSIFLGAYAIKALRKLVPQGLSSVSPSLSHKAATVLTKFGNGCMHSDELVGNACSDGILIAFHFSNISVHLDAEFCHASILVLKKLAEANAKYSHTDSLNTMRTLKCAAASGACLAATSYPQQDVSEDVLLLLHTARRMCIESLVGLLGSAAFRNEEEIAIGVGEALALYADAYNTTENDTVAHPLKTWPETYDEGLAQEMSPTDEVLYILLRKTLVSSSPHTRTSVAPAILAITARAARKVNSNQSNGNCLFVRVLTFHLDEIQTTFINLLSDPKCKHLSRESCCLGLAACRGLIQCQANNSDTTQGLNNKLLRAFGQTTSFAGSALVESQNEARERRAAAAEGQSDTAATGGDANPQVEVGGASGITEAALGAYKEMAAAAVSLDRHDILYTLLVLSVSHPFWFTSGNRNAYSSTALLGDGSMGGAESGTSQLKEVLQPHFDKLLPRILRAKHDPNAQTREQMSSLWIALTGGGAEARASISKHLIVSIDALVIETASKMWRIRAGACSALAEIVVGRDWGSLGGGGAVLNDDDLHSPSRVLAGVRLLRLWRVTMRALDDVRTNVRESGATLARAVRALTIRLCDPSSNEKDSGLKRERDGVARPDSDIIAASATALRWLVRHGLNQHTEGTAFCITCLVEIVGLVTPRMLAPILPDLLRSLLVSISGLEPAALNYLQLRTDDQEGLERARLQLASTGPIASAVTKCLDLTPEVSLETQHSVVVQLDNALRQSAGFATRSAIADAISTLCSTCPAAFQFNGTNSSNASVRLLRALYNASERERTVASRDRLVHSLGSLASVCPGVSVRALALKACQKYNSSTGSNDDPVARSAAAASLRAIAVRASNQLVDGGKMDIWCRYVLPSAFLGKKDDNKKIASQWQDVWEEAASALRSSEVPLIGTTHEENLLAYLVEECIRGLEDVSWSRRTSASNALVELCDSGILAPLTKQLTSTSSSTERQEYRTKHSRLAMERCVLLVRRPRLWTGKIIAVTAASKIAGAWAATFGDERDGQPSTLSFTSGSLDDLFQGDKWFLASNTESEIEDVEMKKPQTTASEDEENETDVEILRPVSQLTLSSNVLTFTGLCRLLLNSAISSGNDVDKNTESLPYRKACFDNLQYLLSKLSSDNDTKKRQTTFDLISPGLIAFIREQPTVKQPPVLVAAAIACLESALYDGFGTDEDEGSSIVELIVQAGGEQQAAWTVRESSAKCLARMVSLCSAECFRTYDFTSSIVASASFSLTDKKFWQVRHGGLSVFQKLVNRAGDASGTPVLEALLPHKETILKQVRACLRDSESRVTALASDILSSMAWWP